MTRISIFAATALAAALLAVCAIGAGAAAPPAAVNECAPGELGVRAHLAGQGSADSMRVRFTAQWLDPATGAWQPVAGSATTPWQSSGRASWNWWEAGWTFYLDRPAAGTTWTLRGVAERQWLRGGSALRSDTAVSGSCTVSG